LPEKFLRKHYYSKFYLDINISQYKRCRHDADGHSQDGFRGNPSEQAVGGASLLQVAHAVYRSCDDAKIPPRLCLCMDEKTLLSKRYTNETAEFRQLFEYSKTEILRNECLQNVTEAPQHHTLSVLSLNAMVQQGVRQENE
uniref:Ku_N domain-containing protein n=1 Tax=Haemonchus placei TaxID=6290 RepID=A0A0N4X332_HAEPC